MGEVPENFHGKKGRSGRKTLREEVALLKRYEAQAPKVFKILEEKLNGSKKEREWAMEWLKSGFVKMIPQKIGGDKDNPIQAVLVKFMDDDNNRNSQ